MGIEPMTSELLAESLTDSAIWAGQERPYISRISPGAPLRPIGTNFGLRVRHVEVISCAKFYRNRLRGSDSMSGQSLTIPIGMRCRH